MKLNDSESPSIVAAQSSSTPSSPSSSHHRSFLAIDLNEVPSPSETLPSPSSSSSTFILSPTSLVRAINDNPPIPEGPPAEIPDDVTPCSGCGGPSPELVSDRLVCDGCERGFHFNCTGVLPVVREEWLCRYCVAEGVGSKRWRLGRKEDRGVRLIDMNASPPSDGDVESLAAADAAAAAAGSSREVFGFM
ncbi:hypothetical protein SOVF_054540 [Spinacia oleracea]|nr:hypothetical protein SOVF_054540 [Spinacia oleracea]